MGTWKEERLDEYTGTREILFRGKQGQELRIMKEMKDTFLRGWKRYLVYVSYKIPLAVFHWPMSGSCGLRG